jgi:hypothetical protein
VPSSGRQPRAKQSSHHNDGTFPAPFLSRGFPHALSAHIGVAIHVARPRSDFIRFEGAIVMA